MLMNQRFSESQIRADDYSFIGAALAGVIVPALLLRRAPFPTLVAGGACTGIVSFHRPSRRLSTADE
jgi:hypothetical protein